jgi:hypothetical protein
MLGLSQLNLSELCEWFTEDEVWNVVRALSPDKASGRIKPLGQTVLQRGSCRARGKSSDRT